MSHDSIIYELNKRVYTLHFHNLLKVTSNLFKLKINDIYKFEN